MKVMFPNLIIIESAERNKITGELACLEVRGAHFTNGVYSMAAGLIVPTTLAGFRYMVDRQPHLPLVIAVNSDKSMYLMGKTGVEPQMVRALKVAEPLAEVFPDNRVIVLFYDEETPNQLYAALRRQGHTRTLHKWGYGTEPSAPKIEGAEFFDFVYGYPLPNDKKPVCWEETPLASQPQDIQVVDLCGRLIMSDGVLFELPGSLKKYQSSTMSEEKCESGLLSGLGM